ncbi:GntR family transcriptional regulator [Streptomyces sp. 8K308]|uniref:GntR family transcriptional regulator n=1 Tax=Streptomyces sp. 8K308 TaxID=2530388 RepID=UPI00104ADCF6|nr:GntR family transcriptional regulator [Streptomyces sp. 8K308]TDC18416.1 GntR family transcriptional regulator [Streptomyces sp. 8K308]
MRGYRDLAEELRQRINAGEFPAGSTLPRIVDLIDQYGLARQTVRDAIGELVDEGLVATLGKGGTQVRHRTAVRIPLARYTRVLRPGGSRGPWETALANQGLDGRMRVVAVTRGPGPADVAAALGVDQESDLLYRQRHATIGEIDVVQLQHAWYSAALADSAGIAGDGKIKGGILAALAAAGITPASLSEQVRARPPLPNETTPLKIGGKVAVLEVERVTKDAQGRVLEVLRSVAPADRIQLTYDDLPLKEA